MTNAALNWALVHLAGDVAVRTVSGDLHAGTVKVERPDFIVVNTGGARVVIALEHIESIASGLDK